MQGGASQLPDEPTAANKGLDRGDNGLPHLVREQKGLVTLGTLEGREACGGAGQSVVHILSRGVV